VLHSGARPRIRKIGAQEERRDRLVPRPMRPSAARLPCYLPGNPTTTV
jgi:hypothetical protein